jgi:hypothetical protein
MQQNQPRTDFGLEEAGAFAERAAWQFAVTMPQWPHEYVLRWRCREQGIEREFEAFIALIYRDGYQRRWGRWLWPSLDLGDHYFWTHWGDIEGEPVSVEKAILINRALREPEQLSFAEARQEWKRTEDDR